MAAKHERILQHEVMLRLKAGYPQCVCVPVPNGLYMPAHSAAEKTLVARLMKRLRDDGMVVPGAPDLVIASATGVLFLELKRPVVRDLFGKRSPKGILSEAQREFRDRCKIAGVPYAIATSWEEAHAALVAHGVIRLPPGAIGYRLSLSDTGHAP